MALDKDKLAKLRIEPQQRVAGRGIGPYIAGAAVLVAVVIAVIAGMQFFAEPEADAPPPLETATAQRPGAAQDAVLDASGYVVARRIATVSSKVTGRVDEVLIEEGMAVEQGQLLAQLDDSTVRAAYGLVESQLESARRNLDETRVRLAEAERQLARTEKLRNENLVSEVALDSARSEVDALRARLSASRSNVKVAERSLAVQQQQLDDLQIRAPFAGIVISKNAQPGEMISPVSAGGGFTRTGIGTIVDMDSREIEVDVNEAYINRVSPGQRVVATLDAYNDWDIPASVINIVPTADRQRATVKVRIAFDQLDARILPDMGVKVRFLNEEALVEREGPEVRAVVPATAIRSDNGTDYVWRVRDGEIERRAVSTARRKGNKVEITAGIEPGDSVVTIARVDLADGDKVNEL
ncbi:MAG: efflux RND transporter periplasmic adaptor subunit [Gammaproteobacteria bacterium]|nr:efflux RND transporter periplasmic adaptor subunit [Gammaproteobacteria bacterium]NNM19921.1 efflux RND transporter periplasmic adaptor subunit [Gammaproteobacteria bacterium]